MIKADRNALLQEAIDRILHDSDPFKALGLIRKVIAASDRAPVKKKPKAPTLRVIQMDDNGEERRIHWYQMVDAMYEEFLELIGYDETGKLIDELAVKHYKTKENKH